MQYSSLENAGRNNPATTEAATHVQPTHRISDWLEKKPEMPEPYSWQGTTKENSRLQRACPVRCSSLGLWLVTLP